MIIGSWEWDALIASLKGFVGSKAGGLERGEDGSISTDEDIKEGRFWHAMDVGSVHFKGEIVSKVCYALFRVIHEVKGPI